jgi:hypothetical protein
MRWVVIVFSLGVGGCQSIDSAPIEEILGAVAQGLAQSQNYQRTGYGYGGYRYANPSYGNYRPSAPTYGGGGPVGGGLESAPISRSGQLPQYGASIQGTQQVAVPTPTDGGCGNFYKARSGDFMQSPKNPGAAVGGC